MWIAPPVQRSSCVCVCVCLSVCLSVCLCVCCLSVCVPQSLRCRVGGAEKPRTDWTDHIASLRASLHDATATTTRHNNNNNNINNNSNNNNNSCYLYDCYDYSNCHFFFLLEQQQQQHR